LRFFALCLVAAGFIATSGALAEEAGEKSAHPMFRWPLIGKAQKAEGGGLDIVVPLGEAVHAAADGTVIFASDELTSFGKMVVIRHADDYVTAYAHLSEMIVGQGVAVKRGQIIGKSGRSGDVGQPELHFELRKSGANLDPVGYLTPR
jgi:murein DD-endopeptidase MepM/ murein hydrolase activator NlpD